MRVAEIDYLELGPDHFTRREPTHVMHRITKQANALGLTVRFYPSIRPQRQPEATHHLFSSQSTRGLGSRGSVSDLNIVVSSDVGTDRLDETKMALPMSVPYGCSQPSPYWSANFTAILSPSVGLHGPGEPGLLRLGGLLDVADRCDGDLAGGPGHKSLRAVGERTGDSIESISEPSPCISPIFFVIWAICRAG